MGIPTVQLVSQTFIKPNPPIPKDSNQIFYLSPWDISMLSSHYNQKGLMFKKPQNHQQKIFLDKLKHSLSLTLFHFYPLSGRLQTHKTQNPHSYNIFIDCENSPGAKFIHANLDLTINDILGPVDVPPIVQSFFDHDRAINHDGHTLSLLTIQVTELIDGVFIGCSMNHCVADGTGYWNFFNTFSEIFQNQNDPVHFHPVTSISSNPIHKRWFPQGYGPIINLPFKHEDDYIYRFEAPKLRERVFHFSAESLSKLKAQANKECNTKKISSFQSLSALVWRSITRARKQEKGERTCFKLAINNRSRIDPPIPNEYFGNSINATKAETLVGELLESDLGWASWKIHEAIENHDKKQVMKLLEEWLRSPFVYRMDVFFDACTVMMSGSPRFNIYGNEFGMGKALGVRSGYANKFDGKIVSFPGRDEKGSIDLEVCLLPERMVALETDQEFMNSASVYNPMF